MKVLVLGSGVVGVSSAWYLAKSGHQVTVIDRQPGAGLETSYANGGQISVSHAEPWSNPHAPLRALAEDVRFHEAVERLPGYEIGAMGQIVAQYR